MQDADDILPSIGIIHLFFRFCLSNCSALASRERHLRFALGSGPRLRPLYRSRKPVGIRNARQFLPRQPLPDYTGHYQQEPAKIAVLMLALIEAESLLVQIPEQMKGLDRNVSPANGALEQAPKVLHPVRVDVPARVALRVIDDVMCVLVLQSLVALQFVRVDRGALQNVLAHVALQLRLSRVLHMFKDDARCTLGRGALQQALYGRQIPSAGASHLPLRPLLGVHRPRTPADKRLVNLHRPANLHNAPVLQRLTKQAQRRRSVAR